MPSTRKMLPYRPDDTETQILEAFQKKTGLPLTRIIGIALREKAEREGINTEAPSKQEDSGKKG